MSDDLAERGWRLMKGGHCLHSAAFVLGVAPEKLDIAVWNWRATLSLKNRRAA